MNIREIAEIVAANKLALDSANAEYDAATKARTEAWERKAKAEEALARSQHELIVTAGGMSFYTEFNS